MEFSHAPTASSSNSACGDHIRRCGERKSRQTKTLVHCCLNGSKRDCTERERERESEGAASDRWRERERERKRKQVHEVEKRQQGERVSPCYFAHCLEDNPQGGRKSGDPFPQGGIKARPSEEKAQERSCQWFGQCCQDDASSTELFRVIAQLVQNMASHSLDRVHATEVHLFWEG